MRGKHEKAPTRSVKKIVWSIIAAVLSVAVLAAGGVWLWQSGVLDTLFSPARQTGAPTSPTTTTTTSPQVLPDPEPEPNPPKPAPVFSRPEQMRAVQLTAGVDYTVGEDADACRTQIDTIFDTLGNWTWNTVLLTLPAEYPADGAFDPTAYILECAREKEMFVYLVLDCGVAVKDGVDTTISQNREQVSAAAVAACTRYAADGILFSGYAYPFGSKPEGDTFINEMLTDAAAAVREYNNNAYIGLLTEAVWAHASVQEGGSATANVYEELTDGGADTRALVQAGAVDFVMVKAHRPTGDYSAPFGTVLSWWSALCEEAEMPLYISHAATKAAEGAKGWTTADQLARQVLACKKAAAWQGSCFDSAAALNTATAASGALQQAFDGTLMEEYISRTLTITYPRKQKVEVSESSLNLRGSADPNFPLTLNGEAVTLTDHGYFSMDVTLKPGANTFVFENKGVTTTYTVTYKIQVLKSVSPSSALALDGGSVITVSALAHKNATVYATIAGTKIVMAETAVQEDENAASAAEYVTFTGTYTLPAGIEGDTRRLGNVVISGEYSGLSETMTGGSITVNALPISGTTVIKPVPLPDLTPINPNVGGAVLGTGTILIVTEDYAETFSGDTTDDYSRPTNAYLPKGTTDLLVGTAYDAVSDRYYYLLGCGRRVYQKEVATYITGGTITENSLVTKGVTVTGSGTAITFDADWRVPFQLQLLPQKYGNPVRQDYSSATQTTEYVELTFSYTTSVSGTPDVANSPLFSRAEWIKGSDNTYVLRLYLTKKAQFYGYRVLWDDAGNITFTFRHPTYTAGNGDEQPLKGFKVVIDPGHGGNSIGTAGGTLAEKTLVLTYSLLLRDKLEALGATVIMTRTDDSSLSLLERNQITRASGADLFISIHMNGSVYASSHGCSVHYFSDYSIDIANTFCKNMKAVYDEYDSPNSGKVVWSPFQVCRVSEMPSLLLECGYMTNAEDLERLITPDFQDALTNAMVKSVLAYAENLPNI